jgi:predicted site-specific integrase-resolvase
MSPLPVILNGMDAYEPERDGELLPARAVCKLLHIARSTLPLWRERGDLKAYKMVNGHWRYPSNQATLVQARAALRPAVGDR